VLSENRNPKPSFRLRLDGPGKLTKFLHIDKTFNGHNMTKGKKVWLEYPKTKRKFRIIKSPRIGIDYAKHCKSWKWNFKAVNCQPNENARVD